MPLSLSAASRSRPAASRRLRPPCCADRPPSASTALSTGCWSVSQPDEHVAHSPELLRPCPSRWRSSLTAAGSLGDTDRRLIEHSPSNHRRGLRHAAPGVLTALAPPAHQHTSVARGALARDPSSAASCADLEQAERSVA